MFCCDLSPVVNPSREAEKLSRYLKWIALGHVAIAILFFVGSPVGFGLTSLILALFLYFASRTFHYCHVTIYIWFLAFDIIVAFVLVGNAIQHNELQKGNDIAKFLLYTSTFIFYCLGIYIAYRSYKEFKALYLFPGGDNDCKFISTIM